jgi:exonuclease SbcC
MRILAIRGENLASLARPFELDLTAEPLAGAGLFAITGETGSGKSTILDALCLALYGVYPRVAVGRQESVPDPSGKELSISDGRAILRRGAAAGFAEVDFLGQDGIGYRARWAVARARGKANGRLQPPQRSLKRLADDSAVAEGITSVLKVVEERTDLTFEQFRRTVLLAQGDFDAFLLAEERERADLLEKVTGTEIYGSISTRVRQGTDQLRREMDSLEQKRLDIGMLSPDARLSLEKVQETLTKTIEEQGAERTRLTDELEKRRIITAAQESLRLAEGQLAIAQEKKIEAQEEFTVLAELEAVEPLRGEYLLAEEAGRALPGVEQKVADTETGQNLAAGIAQEAQASLVKASEATREAEAVYKRFGPVWSEAEGLDSQITSARDEVQKAQHEVHKTEASVTAQNTSLEALQRKLDKATKEHELATEQFAQQSGLGSLSERWEDVLALLQRREENIISNNAAAKNAGATKTTVTNLLADVNNAEGRIHTADQSRKELTQKESSLHEQLNCLNETRLFTIEAGLNQLVLDLREACRLAERAIKATTNLEEGERNRTQALADQEQARINLDAAKTQRDRDIASRTQLAPLDELAQQSVSEQAALLRSFLLPGEACPVCGAAEHPYGLVADAQQPTDALQILAEKLRSQRHKLDEDIAHAANLITEQSALQAAAAARQNEAVRSTGADRVDLAGAVKEFTELRPAIAAAVSTFDLTNPLPSSLETETKEELETLGREASSTLKQVKGSLADAKQIRLQIDAAQKQRTTAQTQYETELRTKQVRIEEHHAAELTLQQHNATMGGIIREIEAVERELSPFLASAGITLKDLQQDAAGIRSKLHLKTTTYRKLKEQIGLLELTVQELKPKCAEAATILLTTRGLLTRSQADLTTRNAALEDKLRQRAMLLNGEATELHRRRFNDARLAASAVENSASLAQSAAASAHRGAVVAYEQAVAASIEAQRREAETRKTFNEACIESGCSCDWALERLRMPSDNRAETRARLQRIDHALNIAQANMTTRTNDLGTARVGVDESFGAMELSAVINALNEEISTQQQRFGEIASDLKRDKQAQDEARALGAEIEAKRTQLDIWQAVDDAIGSPDGSRFRKFVQGITLEHLVRLANDHLSAIGPRYQLAQGITSDLAVHVVDRDMADELRAARSLSGGERFLVSLSLALALSGLEGRSSFVDTLFIDEGFGSLDQETLDIALDALESLHSRGRKVAVITHVAAMIDRIVVQVRVEKLGGGHSVVRLIDGQAA